MTFHYIIDSRLSIFLNLANNFIRVKKNPWEIMLWGANKKASDYPSPFADGGWGRDFIPQSQDEIRGWRGRNDPLLQKYIIAPPEIENLTYLLSPTSSGKTLYEEDM